ncbi:MAG: type II toxin-antitoxin system VapC family toxin [Deltaproteobacteria bacterium]|nr:type II toxin-antitoxin system VapC family toxin [Deltaproteobacteria bacterium]
MAQYVDTSAWLKRYVDEPDSDRAVAYLAGDPDWFSGRHTYVEVRRNLARLLEGSELSRVKHEFEEDWRRVTVIELDVVTTSLAADIAEDTGLRTLDALHLGAVLRLGATFASLLTFDIRQAQVARKLGLVVNAS